MLYEEMLMNVAVGRVAYRLTDPDMVVFRSGDTISRRVHRKQKMEIPFIASYSEMRATDWQIVDDEEEENELQISFHPHEKVNTIVNQVRIQ